MVSKVFIDSDVIIDFFTDREPFVNPASELFDLNEKGLLKLHISTVSTVSYTHLTLPTIYSV